MIAAALLAPTSFTPPGRGVQQSCDRRELISKVAGGVIALGGLAQGASAKAGQFGKQEIFGFGTSSPYVGEKVVSGSKAGSMYNDDVKSTYGFAPTGDILAKGYASDVTREKKVYEKTVALVSSLQGDIDSKTWWRIRDQLRGTDVYSLRSSMLAINGVLPTEKKPDAAKAYKKVFVEMESLDLACKKKEQALATKENNDLLAALAAYGAIID